MLRKLAVVLTGLALVAGTVAAYPADTKKEEPKKARVKVTRGTPYKIISVDAAAKSAVVADEAGKKRTIKIGESTVFHGPYGGPAEKGIKDDRFVPGQTVRLVLQGQGVKEIILPVRPAAAGAKDKKAKDTTKKTDDGDKKTKKKTDDEHKADEKKTDEKKTDKKKTKKSDDTKKDDEKKTDKKKTKKKTDDEKKTDGEKPAKKADKKTEEKPKNDK